MQSYHAANFATSQRLTQLYTDTKRSSQVAFSQGSVNDAPELQALNRKFRLQKDRLIAWGFEWSNDAKDGDIDRSVEQAGLTEVVESVMENIKDTLEAVERLNAPLQPSPYPAEKSSMPRIGPMKSSDMTRYEDLVKEMSSAIDLLCDLSRSRRPPLSEESGKAAANDSKGNEKQDHGFNRPTTPVPAYPNQGSQFDSLSRSLHTVPTAISTGGDIGGIRIPKISPSLLAIPQEGPPAYGDSKSTFRGASSSPRLFGYLQQPRPPGSSSPSQPGPPLIPVMIEYARFDRLYKGTEMPLPLSRLEQVHSIMQSWDSRTSSTLVKPIAYFEDPAQPRIGLIFEFPSQMQVVQQDTPDLKLPAEPTTLSTLLQEATTPHDGSSTANAPIIPPLEHRFRLAQELVGAFEFLQQRGFAHRNVSSSSIALLPHQGSLLKDSFDLRRPLLCSVDLFSEYDVDPSPEMLHQNIYRHPDDPRIRGPSAAREYDIRFDLYSLSLVLLEIGLWHPLADLYKEKYSLKDFRTRVEKVWIRRLAGRCGTPYTRCVYELFQAGNSKQGTQDYQYLVSVCKKAHRRLQQCCLLEEEADEEPLELATESEAPPTSDLESMSTFLPEKELIQSEPATINERDRRALEQGARSPCFLFPDLKVPSDVEKMYESFEDRAARIANKVLKGPMDSFWLALEYAGATRESAKPTICVGCSNPKLVRAALKKHLRYDSGIFELSVFRDSVRRSKFSKITEPEAQNPNYHERPLCGASLGAWRYGEHSAAVSFGGVVLVDNKPYGMTVHHVLEPEEDEKDIPTKSLTSPIAENNGLEVDLSALDLADDADEEDINDDNDEIMLDDDDEDIFDEAHEDVDNDTPGVVPGEGRRIVVTQPALDDLEIDFFPCEEDRDEEHTLSHRLGHVYASSGLRFYETKKIRHEMDWLLFEVDDNRLQRPNVIAGGRRHCSNVTQRRPSLKEPVCRGEFTASEDIYPRQVVLSDELSGLEVHCSGRTCGLGHGRVSDSMRWVRFCGRNNPARVWSVRGTFGMGGDSGAWAADSAGRIAGHVLGWSSNLGVAYISPMDVMFDDIRRTLSARTVMLPGAIDRPGTLTIPKGNGLFAGPDLVRWLQVEMWESLATEMGQELCDCESTECAAGTGRSPTSIRHVIFSRFGCSATELFHKERKERYNV